MRRFLFLLLILAGLAPAALAQESSPGLLAGLLEEQLSAEGRTVKVHDVRGALTSQAEIGEITVADTEGIWLRITNAKIDWNRRALFSRRLSINELAAESIDIPRKPVSAPDGLPSPESTALAIPELPVAIDIAKVSAAKVSFGADLFGLQSVVTLDGRLLLEDGNLETALSVTRLDGPGGAAEIAADFRKATQLLNVRAELEEPANGLLANAINIEGRPPITIRLNGTGPLDNFASHLTVATDQGELVSGSMTLLATETGRGFELNVSGEIASMLPADVRGFFAGSSAVRAAGQVKPEGGFALQELAIETAAARLQGRLATGADGFLSFLDIQGSVGSADGAPVVLPMGGGDATLQSGKIAILYDPASSDRLLAEFGLGGLVTPQLTLAHSDLRLDGRIENAQDPANRRIQAIVSGQLDGESQTNEALQFLLEDNPSLRGGIDWQAGGPVFLRGFGIESQGLSATLNGQIDGSRFEGSAAGEVARLGAFAGIAKIPVDGSARLMIGGQIDPIGGLIDLNIDGTSNDLQIGIGEMDRLMQGTTRMVGNIRRDTEGLRTDGFTLSNEQVTVKLQGWLKSRTAIGAVAIRMPDAGIVIPGKTGEFALTSELIRLGDRIQTNITMTAPEDVRAELAGDIALPDLDLDLSGTIQDVPLDLLNILVPEQNFQGVLSANVGIGGTAEDPSVTFAAEGANLRSGLLDRFNFGSVRASVLGSYQHELIRLQGISAVSTSGMNASAKGTIPLDGTDMEITAQGIIPLNIVNAFLIDRSARAGGLLNFTGSVGGPLSSPEVFGAGNINEGRFVDPNTKVRLDNVSADVELSGQNIIFKSARAQARYGGTIEGSGRILLDATQGFPADLNLRLLETVYDDGQFVRTTLSADLGVTGTLLTGAYLTGTINIDEAELRLAEAPTSSYGPVLDVTHKGAPAEVLATRRRAGLDKPREAGGDWFVDLDVLAPRRIFVRGHGIDAELGGSVHLGGTVSDIQPSGEIGLIRGRMDILGQRLTLTDAGAYLTGSLNPSIHMTATTQADDLQVEVRAFGTLEAIEFDISSVPDLPDEEVLARLIFGTSVDQLSTLQLIRLAAAAANLAGGDENSLFSRTRSKIGLDDLDIRAGENGDATAAAGAYVGENIYLDVEATTSGDATFSVNLDLTSNTKAKASVGSDGESSIGIFFEKDY